MHRGFSIQFVSRITGINAHTIRAWEKRYGAVVPQRSESGKRVYSQAEVDRLGKLHELVKLGSAISDVAGLSDIELKSLHEQYVDTDRKGSRYLVENNQINLASENIIALLKNYRFEQVIKEVERIRQALVLEDFVRHFLIPFVEEVQGDDSEILANRTLEQSLSSIIKAVIGRELFLGSTQSKHEGVTLIASPEGELNELGIIISTLLISSFELPLRYFGPSMPAQSLAQVSKDMEAVRIILGVTPKYNQAYNKRLEEYLQKLITHLPSSITEVIVVGETGLDGTIEIGSKVKFVASSKLVNAAFFNV